MKVYGQPYSPVTTFLVHPELPTQLGGALVPGPFCPCFNGIFYAVPEVTGGGGARRDKCPDPAQRTRTITYTKRPLLPGVEYDEEFLAKYNRAWSSIKHVTIWKREGSLYSETRFWPTGEDESTECAPLSVIKDTWDPGSPEDNPGEATYDSESVTTDVDVPPLSPFGPPPFRDGGRGDPTRNVAWLNKDGTEGLAIGESWRWTVDLSWFFERRRLPPEFVLKGFVVWDNVDFTTTGEGLQTKTNYSTTTHSESFSLTKDAPIWHGETRTASPPMTSGVARGSNNYQIITNFYPLL